MRSSFWDWVNSKYLPALLDYLKELRRRGFTVIACRGIGDSDREAKRPVNIPRGFDYAFGKPSLDLTESTIKLVENRQALAFGIPGAPNRILWLDIEAKLVPIFAVLCDLDIYSPPSQEEVDEIFEKVRDLDPETAINKALRYISEFFDLDKVYIEKTANYGLHVGLRIETEQEYSIASSITGVKGYVDNKLHGYVIAYPSMLAVRKESGYEVLLYEKLSECEIWDTTNLSSYAKQVSRLLLILKAIVDYEIITVRSGEGKIEYKRVIDDITSEVARLPLEHALLFFYLVCKEVGCDRCVQYYVQKLINNEPWELSNLTYPTKIPRGLHYALELELAGSMYLLGFSEDQLIEIGERIRYKDYVPETPPIETVKTILRYGVRNTSIGFMGACPVLIANEISGRYVNKSCTSKLSVKINTLIHVRPHVIWTILRYDLPRVLKELGYDASGLNY